MTIRDHEVIELLGDKPELLAIADAVSATQPRPANVRSRRRRRVVVRTAIVAAAAAAAIVAILAAPQSNPGIIGKALAAVGDGPIMHVVIEAPSGVTFVNLETGHRTVQIFRQELWASRSGDQLHLVLSLHGKVLGDLLFPQDATGGVTTSPPDPAFAALWTGYRAALENGTATLAGSGHILGHHVYWLRFKQTDPDQPRVEVAVDAHSYQPILERTFANGIHIDQRILVAKAIPYAPAEFKRRGPKLFGSGSTSEGGTSTGTVNPSAPPPTTVHAPWLTAGDSVAGLKLRAATQLTSTNGTGKRKKTLQGLELVYGSLANGLAGPLSTTVDELPRPDDPRMWSRIPAGSLEIESSEESSSSSSSSHPHPKNTTHRLWTGMLKKDGVYVTITTPKSERALLQIARSLHRGSK
jgi:hypothetical protein